MSDYDFLHRVVLVGNSAVGKSSFLSVYADQHFSQTFLPTIGVDFKIKAADWGQKKVKLQLWDTAGQERFQAISRSYYKGAKAILIFFDLTDRASFIDVSKWIQQIQSQIDITTIDLFLVGNKLDDTFNRSVQRAEAQKLAKEYNFREYHEVSCKEFKTVNKVIFSVLKFAVEKHKRQSKASVGVVMGPQAIKPRRYRFLQLVKDLFGSCLL